MECESERKESRSTRSSTHEFPLSVHPYGTAPTVLINVLLLVRFVSMLSLMCYPRLDSFEMSVNPSIMRLIIYCFLFVCMWHVGACIMHFISYHYE